MPKARILAVDDQLYFRVFLEDLLQQEGYEVCTASGGEEALDLLQPGRFDVVLTDLVMPGMDGDDLVQKVKEKLPDQEIVVVTSLGDVKTAVEATPHSLIGMVQPARSVKEGGRLADEEERQTALA